MSTPDFGRLRWRLLAANLAVATAGVAAVVAAVWLAAPRAFEDAMGMRGSGGMMSGGTGMMSGGMMDPVLRSAFGDAVGTALLLGFAAAVVVAVIVSLLLATRIARPIDDLAAASKRVARGDYSEPVPAAAGELGELAGAFNGMAASLAANEQRRRDLIGDVAHELRTPIASVRGYVAGLEAGIFAPGPETWRVLDEQTARLEHLVDDLAILWRAESSELYLEPVALDAATELAAVARRLRPAAAARESAIIVDAPPGLVFRADRARTAQVLDNLVANAVTHGREGGRIRLIASPGAGFVRLTVADDGPGMTLDQLAHAFERFYRADPSRSRAAGGSGLGLAISRTLVEAMHGSIEAASEGPERGTVMAVLLPIAGG